jgi:hypothetical protein
MFDPNAYLLTLDVDWAPDSAIEFTADLLKKYHVKATWFATHASEQLRKVSELSGLFELGIHPNFLRGSTHGDTEEAVFRHLLNIIPEAKAMRTHSLYQSTPLLSSAIDYGIHVDLSLLLPRASHLQPHALFFKAKRLIRLPTFWEDDVEMTNPMGCLDFLKSNVVGIPGLKIFSFHPIHILLNSATLDSYEKLKKDGYLATKTLRQVEPYTNMSIGTRTFFEQVCEYVAKEQGKSYTVSDLVNDWEIAG